MERKKIAIMTWYTYRNFGTALQASALTHVIESMGYSPYMIQYLPKGGVFEPTLRSLQDRIVQKFKSLCFRHYTSSEREQLFASYFKARIRETAPMRSYPELNDLNADFDAFVCGSDQIWSPNCFDDKYFLSFVDQNEKMIAYAPSLGVSKISNRLIESRMATYLERFQHLSVREQQGAELIYKMTGKRSEVVLDPTLLLNSAEWDSYAETNQFERFQNGDYILCYFLGNPQKYMNYVRRFSNKTNLPIYVIPVSASQKRSKYALPFEVGPREFVSLIKHAKYVCTDSFHGMAFSINYNVPFVVFERFKNNDSQNQNSRIFNLLKILELENRLVNSTERDISSNILSCNYGKANYLLQQYRHKSIEYLQQTLLCATNFQKAEKEPCKITDMCCGCGACASVCRQGAISIHRNEEGFEHYVIDNKKCVSCGQCKTVCPMTNVVAPDLKSAHALYAVKSRSEIVLKTSSSGGIGYELSKLYLKEGFAVCGCIYDANNNVAKHIWVLPGEEDKLKLLQGSKYIQSISADALTEIAYVAQNHKILFFGTPCQGAAVDKILQKKGLRENALIIDLICHGVPSYSLWEKFLRETNNTHGIGNNPNVTFRRKEKDWHRRFLIASGNGKQYKKSEKKDDFYAFFRRGLCDMKSCSDCPYRERSAADLRIGDYWGRRFLKDKNGISMVLANTSLGQQTIEYLRHKDVCKIETYPLIEYWSVQYPYNANRPLVRETLIEELGDDTKTLHQLRKKYCMYYDRVEQLSNMVQSIRFFRK